ncbi:MAG: DNA polymerase III subunit beta [Muribaculaceae bacterium]|nr:DNA polymerase III subunit beta [Muribaculaceae bacterium]MDE6134633.1 DNA polymerase III subunit beta [Muribaculaceae bacterium]
MKFSVSSKAFYNAASAVSKVINAKNALAILDNFLLSVEGNTLTITGSDQENALTARVEVSGAKGSGSFCLGARRLVELLKELPDQGMEVKVNEDNLEVQLSYASGHYSFVGLPSLQYPEFKAEAKGEPVTFSIATEQMIAGLDNTMFAVSTDEYRQIMQGVLFDVAEDCITFVATDTRKLVRYIDRRTAPGVTCSCVIPSKPSNIIKNVFAKEETMEITMNPRSARIQSEHFTFECTFLNGSYPDYNRVIPKNNTLILTVDRAALLNAVRRVGIFVEVDGGLEKLRITPECILLKSNDPNLCTSAREQVPCSFTGNELTIGFGAGYLVEILNTIRSQEVVVNLGDAGRPGVFRPGEEPDNTELVMLLMPMTVGDF